jgi:hypothetical protein
LSELGLTLYQAREIAISRYGKNPAIATLKTACHYGRLKASRLPISATKVVWTVTETDLADYLKDWQGGKGAKPGERRAVGNKSRWAGKQQQQGLPIPVE